MSTLETISGQPQGGERRPVDDLEMRMGKKELLTFEILSFIFLQAYLWTVNVWMLIAIMLNKSYLKSVGD